MEHHMQKHPMLSVKEAAEALRIDERSVRERLANGTLKGEKKQVGLRDKWFVYASAISSALAKQDGNFIGNSVAVQDVRPNSVEATTVFVAEEQETIDATYGDLDDVTPPQSTPTPSRGDWRPENKANLESLVETFMKPLVDKVATQERALIEQAALVAQQEKVIEEQKVQLRLLPDLQRRAEQEAEAAKAAELKLHEAAALKKQLDLMAESKALELQAKEAELSKMQSEISALEHERVKAEQLEEQINELQQAKSQLELKLQDEIHRLKSEKDSQAKAVQEQLLKLTQKLEKLDQPWWRKLFVNKDEQK